MNLLDKLNRSLCTFYGVVCVLLVYSGVNGYALKCLRCDDVLEPRFCERIEYCQDGDVCGVQKYRKENGDVSFWTGCLPHSNCAKVTNRTILNTNSSRRALHGSVLCQECCYGDLCNSEGCGAPGLPASRGPICFDCAHTLNPTDCHHVTVCGANELCFLGEKPIFGQRYFTSYCEDVHACENHASAPIIFGKKRSMRGQRSYTPCSGCCHGDLCNVDCNATFTPDTVINTGSTASPTGVQEKPGNYAFYAQLTSITTNSPVIFDNVTTNEGSAYSGSSGIFTCKYSGTYAFSWTIAVISDRYTSADLVVNDVAIGSSFTDSRGRYVKADSSTGFVVYDLKIGDNVKVNINGSANMLYSTFSGWRLQYGNDSFYAKALSTLSRPTSSSHHGFSFGSILNNRNVYNSANGIFTCPETGLYALALSVETTGGRDFMVNFYRRGMKLNEIGIWPDTTGGIIEDTSSTLQLFSLSKGDQVYVYSTESDAILKRSHSTFSGWRLGPSSSDTPAFLAYLSSSSGVTPIRYDRELLDTSSSFSTTYFSTPKDGVYLFFWNMEAADNKIHSYLQINDVTVGQTVSDGHTAGYDSGSNLAILRLRKNDHVRVKQDFRADGEETMFSGYYMFP